MSTSTPSSLPTKAAIETERERRYSACLRELLEQLGDRDWPAWPAEADSEYQRWVRSHWTIAACDRFDAIEIARHDLSSAELRLLAVLIVDEAEEASAARALLQSTRWPVWPAEFAGDWQAWVRLHWPASWAVTFLRNLEGARRDLGYGEQYCQRALERAQHEVDVRLGLVRGEMSDTEMARLLERRVCGIRGRYRVLGTQWERKQGITRANIDAP